MGCLQTTFIGFFIPEKNQKIQNQKSFLFILFATPTDNLATNRTKETFELTEVWFLFFSLKKNFTEIIYIVLAEKFKSYIAQFLIH